MKLKIAYIVIFFSSFFIAFFLYPHLRTCPSEAWGYYGPKNIEDLVIIAYVFKYLVTLFICIDTFKELKKNWKTKPLKKLALTWVLVLIIIWYMQKMIHTSSDIPNHCDKIIGPADTGLYLSMISICILALIRLIFLSKIKSLKHENE